LIRRNRALAYLKTGHYDAALADSGYPIFAGVDFNEKSLFRAAEALYYLERFDECVTTLKALCSVYPGNELAMSNLKRAEDRVREQTTGEYEFAKLQEEAKNIRPPILDHATYKGPLEVKYAEGKGRGLFVTKAVKAGELLLCEKAFCYKHVGPENPSIGFPETRDILFMHHKVGFSGGKADLCKRLIHKLDRNPSVADRFYDLYSGNLVTAGDDSSGNADHIVDT